MIESNKFFVYINANSMIIEFTLNYALPLSRCYCKRYNVIFYRIHCIYIDIIHKYICIVKNIIDKSA